MQTNRQAYRLNKDIFVERSNKIHHNKYDYSQCEYKNHRTKVIIICPEHGEFLQTPKNHMKGQGCPECGKYYAQTWQQRQFDNFVNESINRFNGNYSFPFIEEEYINSHSVVTIRCDKCKNEFKKIACDHLTSPNGGCQHCYYCRSSDEQYISEFIKEKLGSENVLTNKRDIIKNYEIDIFIPSKNIAIEYNGLYWHSEYKKNKYYHLDKLRKCEQNNIMLIQIFEDEFKYKQEIVLSKLVHIVGKSQKPRIYARKCIIKEISFDESNVFLNKNHIQGGCRSTIYLGAFYQDNLVSVMSFKKENKNSNKWELTRFASDINYNVVATGSKLFSYFIKNYNPEEIKSFADRRWTSLIKPNLYDKLNFKKETVSLPDYKYIKNGTCQRQHKFNFRKKILNKKYGLDLSMTENEMTKQLGYYKIWDCGLIKYVWKNS